MSILSKTRLIHYSGKTVQNQGFTLIELLVVVIILGILAAVALPNLLSQVGKARESSAKAKLGIVAHSQQAYHYEHQVFATDLQSNLGLSTSGDDDYEHTNDSSADATQALHTPYATDPTDSRARDFAVGVY